MREYILGFIGAGNMSQAIIRGAIEKKAINSDKVFVFDIDNDKMKAMNAANVVLLYADMVTPFQG